MYVSVSVRACVCARARAYVCVFPGSQVWEVLEERGCEHEDSVS